MLGEKNKQKRKQKRMTTNQINTERDKPYLNEVKTIVLTALNTAYLNSFDKSGDFVVLDTETESIVSACLNHNSINNKDYAKKWGVAYALMSIANEQNKIPLSLLNSKKNEKASYFASFVGTTKGFIKIKGLTELNLMG